MANSSRRWLRFSLRTLFLLFVVASISLASIIIPARRQRKAVHNIEQAGGSVLYDYEYSEMDPINLPPTPPQPEWLLKLFGRDAFCSVDGVFLDQSDESIEILKNLKALPDVIVISLGPKISDESIPELIRIFSTYQLKDLVLEHTNFSEQGVDRLKSEFPDVLITSKYE